jgi:hypothetical protein
MQPCFFLQRPYAVSQQRIQRRSGLLALLFLFLIAGLAACDQSGQPRMLSQDTDPCTLVTQSQAEQVLHDIPLTVYPSPTYTNGDTYIEHGCNYINDITDNGTPHLVINLLIFHDISATRTTFQSYITSSSPEQGIRLITGLGEQAFLFTSPVPALYAQTENGIVVVAVSNCCASDSIIESQEQQLARFAIQNM